MASRFSPRPIVGRTRRLWASPLGRKAGRSTLVLMLGCGVVLLLQGLAPESSWLESLLGAVWLLGSAWLAFYAEQHDWDVAWRSVRLPWLK
ncbi:MAG: hypothetical protein VKK80_07630 [Prochlorothrix sp.]|nr:hypothetical protein [Prochlorothrix sp.]